MSFADEHRAAWDKAKAAKKPSPIIERSTSTLSQAQVEVEPTVKGQHDPIKQSDEDQLMQASLEIDMARLQATNSHQQRDVMKADELIDKYVEYLERVMEAGIGEQNDVLVRNMIWAIDVQQFTWAIELGAYATEHQLETPDGFSRDIRNLFCGEISAYCLKEQNAGNSVDGLIITVFGMSRNWDLVDKISAEMFKAMANELAGEDDQKALDYYKQALALDEKSGVKQLITKLEKQLATPAAQNPPSG